MNETDSPNHDSVAHERGSVKRHRIREAMGEAAGTAIGLTGGLLLAGYALSSCSPTIESDTPPDSYSEVPAGNPSGAEDFEIDYNLERY